MKILAIRGCNLASLARQFEVDLTAGELAGSGIFAICGPVGAGKSTLLDALCLALFDRTPRLSGRGGVAVAEQDLPAAHWLHSHDPRTLLRRGAAAGFAEVDFTGRDGRRYRSRWSVRRARRRADGRIQPQELVLTDLEHGAVVASGGKGEVLTAIQARLGLDFAQFCRSVLLAQGEFAAFLAAPADERASLLESLTGADIYRRISRAAHERSKVARQREEQIRAQMDGLELLDDGERAEFEGRAAAKAREIEVAEVAVRLAQQVVSWYSAAAEHRREESERTADLQRAQAENRAAEARRQRVAQLLKALPLTALVERLAERQRAVVTAVQQVEEIRERLDRQRRVAAELARASRERLDVAFGLGATAEAPPLILEFSRWQSTLRRWLRGHAEWRAFGLSPEAAAAATRTAAAAAKAAAERLAGAEFAELPARRQRMLQTRQSLAAAQAAARDWVAASDSVAERRAQVEALVAERDRLAEGFDQLAKAVEAADRALHAAERAAEHARVRGDLAAFAEHLVTGEPCPLCGSAEHPNPVPRHGEPVSGGLPAAPDRAHGEATGSAPDNRRVSGTTDASGAADREQAAARLARVRAEREAARDALATREADRKANARQLDGARAAVARAEGNRDDRAAEFCKRLAALGDREHDFGSERRGREAEAEAAAAARAGTGGRDGGASDARLARAAAAVDRQIEGLVAEERAVAALADRHDDVRAEWQAALDEERRAQAASRCAAAFLEVSGELEPALVGVADWRARLARLGATRGEDAPTPVAARDAAAGDTAARDIAADDTAGDDPAADTTAADATAADATALDEAVAAAAAHPTAAAAAGEAAVAAVVTGCERSRAAAARVLEIEEELRSATAARERSEADFATVSAELETAAQAAKITVGAVREAAAAGATAVIAEQQALDRLGAAEEQARAVVQQCARVRRRHERTNRPAIHQDDAAQALEDSRRSKDVAERELRSVQDRLSADDFLRRQRDELAPRLRTATANREVWGALDELIGHSRGDRFAVFAQGLTLDLLLQEANRRLADLARRYRLEKNRGRDMDFVVVDLDLGGARRGLQSLSGGETFLVSLALALALATLAAPRSRVETLFLDEGFGTLDAQNLEAALGALDSLQAGGCQIGIISHVDGIAERIGTVVDVVPEGGGQSQIRVRTH